MLYKSANHIKHSTTKIACRINTLKKYLNKYPHKKFPSMNNSITGKAVAILIDNSPASINGDFYPNRIEAQKIAIERLSTYLFSISSYSQVALITMSPDEFGIRSSFTTMSNKINSVLRNINASSHLSQDSIKKYPINSLEKNPKNNSSENVCPILLEKSLKTALVMIDHFHYQSANNEIIDPISNKGNNNKNETSNSFPHVEKQILAFICSRHDLITDQKVKNIKEIAIKKDVTINIVAFGPDVNDKEFLRDLTQSENSTPDLNLLNPIDINTSTNFPSQDSPSKKKVITTNSNKKIKLSNNSTSTTNCLHSQCSSSGEFLDILSLPNEILSDIILSSRIGTGSVKPQIPVKALLKTNPDLFEAVYDSLLSYKRQFGTEIDPSVEHQIQVLENCMFPTPKISQRSNSKLQKVTNSVNTSPIPIHPQNIEKSNTAKENNDNNRSDIDRNSSSSVEQKK